MDQSTEEKLHMLCTRLKEQGVEIEELSHLTLAVESTKTPSTKRQSIYLYKTGKEFAGNLERAKSLSSSSIRREKTEKIHCVKTKDCSYASS